MPVNRFRLAIEFSARAIGAALLGTTAGIHAYLYTNGYNTIPTIGGLFLFNVIAGSVLALAVLGTPRAWLPLPALGAAFFEAGTAAALLVTEHRGLFGFQDSSQAPLFWQSFWVEVAGAALLLVLCVAVAGHLVQARRTKVSRPGDGRAEGVGATIR
jgi:hypothetical protein